ncbi:MAG TPA: Maf family protein [Dehalococcoidia bacterium]|nr:Maf family protein [Dehalococcoidia bacterium]
MSGPPPPRPPLILASASPRRRELLPALRVPFSVRAADVDETPPAGALPERAAAAIAERKASAALAFAPPGALVLAADTVVACDGRALGKPRDAAEARLMLTALAGREHAVFTAVVLACGARQLGETAGARVLMRGYSADEIEASIAAGTPFDKAGAYAIQDPLLHPAERCDGCYCNVMGLPLWTVRRLLQTLAPALRPAPPDATLLRCAACPLRDGAD